MQKTVKTMGLKKKRSPDYSAGKKMMKNGTKGNTSYLPFQALDTSSINERVNKYKTSNKLFSNLIASTELPVNFFAEKVFEKTPKTITKYKNEAVVLPAAITEIAVKFEIMHEFGVKIFGSQKDFNRWLGEENIGLNFRKPSEFLNTSTGIEQVYDELVRIAFGATA